MKKRSGSVSLSQFRLQCRPPEEALKELGQSRRNRSRSQHPRQNSRTIRISMILESKATTGENLGFYKEYVAGMMDGLATVVVGHPFDTVKVKLQKHNTDVQGLRYKNGLHCASRILQTEGVKGLYRGATSSFFGMAFESSLLFGIYSQTKLFLRGNLPDDGPRPAIIIPSAMCGGAVISFVLCPTELVKVKFPEHHFFPPNYFQSTISFPTSWQVSNNQPCIGNTARQCSAYTANAASEKTWTMKDEAMKARR